MARSTKETDSGNYVNGVYTSKNGDITAGGLNCPKGVRLYDTSMQDAIFYMPEDRGETEDFEMITQDAAPDVLPYYAISNYGRLLNIKSGKIMKPNYRPNGYEYFCLSADNCKYGQKKYNTHRLVMKTFDPCENMDELQVNHINTNKSDNYINKTMPDGTIQSNLEWATPKENIQHIEAIGRDKKKLSQDDAKKIRELHDQGYSYEQIRQNGYGFVCGTTIQNVCTNKIYIDPDYTPKSYYDSYKTNPANTHRLTDEDADKIRDLNSHGYNYKEIHEKFYPNFSVGTISEICRNISHNR